MQLAYRAVSTVAREGWSVYPGDHACVSLSSTDISPTCQMVHPCTMWKAAAGVGPCGNSIRSQRPSSSQGCLIIKITPCKPYLLASAPRFTHWGGGKLFTLWVSQSSVLHRHRLQCRLQGMPKPGCTVHRQEPVYHDDVFSSVCACCCSSGKTTPRGEPSSNNVCMGSSGKVSAARLQQVGAAAAQHSTAHGSREQMSSWRRGSSSTEFARAVSL
jgi:hypothetical protein